MSGKTDPQLGASEKSDNGQGGTTKLDQMMEEFMKKNPGKGIRKIRGGT